MSSNFLLLIFYWPPTLRAKENGEGQEEEREESRLCGTDSYTKERLLTLIENKTQSRKDKAEASQLHRHRVQIPKYVFFPVVGATF